MVALVLPETLPPDRRHTGGLGSTMRTFGALIVERRFLGLALTCGIGAGAMFAYIAGSPFVIQHVYGASPQLFGLLFGVAAVAMVVGAQVNAHLVMRRGPERLIPLGLASMVLAGAGLIVAALFPGAGLAALMLPLCLLLFSWSFVQANAFALALTDHPRVAGTASALLGVCQYGAGAVLSPLVGLGGQKTALPWAVVILGCGLGASLAFGVLVARSRAALGDLGAAAGKHDRVALEHAGSEQHRAVAPPHLGPDGLAREHRR
jgi:DHA1 family bicyclomycin/chloramphenicol resistance-like MFS transporter